MAVTIQRERPDQRRHHRLTAPLFVEVSGHRVRAADWSLGGLRVEGFPGDLPSVGTAVDLAMTLPFQGFDVAFKATAEVVRAHPARGMFAVQFIELGDRERELMAHFIEELVRGHMGDAADTIQRIDVPVTPASLQPDEPRKPPNESADAKLERLPWRRWPVKTIAMSAFYIVLGVVVFSYAGILTYSNFFRMEVPTAVITAPVEMVEAQADGHLEFAGLKQGDSVRSGDVLLNLIDGKLEREIELADIAVKERKAKLIYLKRRHADELERVKSFAAIEMKNVEQARLSLEAANVSLQTARNQYARLKILYDKGFATQSRLEEAQEKMVTLDTQLASRRIELATRVGLAEDDIGKRLYTGDDLIGKSGELDAEVRLAEHDIALSQQRYIANLKMRDSLAVRAPFDGTILKLPRFDKSAVRRGDVIAIVEQRRNRQVTAFLTQDEVAKVGLGDQALLYLPALGETLAGRVTSIDRTSGFIREQEQRANPGYAWRGPTDRSAQVSISFDDDAVLRDSERYRSGLPVTVIFEQRTQNSILSGIASKLAVSM
ncbi:MAG: HlyD family efflux transporter periplasmic adaptor subunit [Alphaproteobacteria bacterium]|nr:HlyD family efflux transporter periplasmic adaptor subunit [Alphaproteobacteria bacterium]